MTVVGARRKRPFSQNLIIGLALFLALILAYVSIKRLADGMEAKPKAAAAVPPSEAASAEAPRALPLSPSYAAVSSLPPAAGKKARRPLVRPTKAPPPPR